MPEARVADRRRQRRVVRQLNADGRVDASAVQVEVQDGIAVLTGSVDSAVAKHAAQEAAHRVPGVPDVVNHVVLGSSGGGPASDVNLCRAVRRALQRAVRDHQRIRTSVERGWVTLCGAVATVEERERAERAVEQVPGVRGGTNGIHVEGPSSRPGRTRLR